jgi:raffinose/stachyose/melibiose transport system permease protein
MTTSTVNKPRVTQPVQRRKLVQSGQRRKSNSDHPMWFLIPAFVILALFFVGPTIYNFIYPFTSWSAFNDTIKFVGLDNFEAITADGSLVAALRVTLIYAILVGVLQNLFGILLALLLEKDTRLNRGARAAFFLPVLLSALATGYIFQALLKPAGALNGILSWLTGTDISIAWLGDTTWTIVVVSLIHAWKWMGLSMLVYLAGLKSVNPDLIEAARLDGAGPWQVFKSIKLPLLAPAVTFNVATALIGTMNGFDIVQATTAGGPARSTEVLNIFIFRTFGQGLYSQATAMSLVLFLVLIVLAVPLVTYLRKREKAMD